eukprot:9801929-Lingulodinium_polyedra.AAC.1
MPQNDAVKFAVCRIKAAKFAACARAMRAPCNGARVLHARGAYFAALKRRTACLTASPRSVGKTLQNDA